MKLSIPKLSSALFNQSNSVQVNYEYLFEHFDEYPFLRTKKGWAPIGYALAP